MNDNELKLFQKISENAMRYTKKVEIINWIKQNIIAILALVVAIIALFT